MGSPGFQIELEQFHHLNMNPCALISQSLAQAVGKALRSQILAESAGRIPFPFSCFRVKALIFLCAITGFSEFIASEYFHLPLLILSFQF